MANRTDLTLFLVSAGTFLSGVAVGMLLAPKSGRESREWIGHQTQEATHWMDQKSKEALHQSEEQVDKLAQNIKSKVRDSLPDLYDATENLSLDESDLENDRN